MQDKKQIEIIKNRLVVCRIIDIINFIAKQGISYRRKNKSCYFLNKLDIQGKGNFLELVLLLAKYDEWLKNYLEIVTEKSKQRKLKNPDSKGKGDLVTFLSKNTINKLLIIICEEIQRRISDDVKRLQVLVCKQILHRI